MDVGKRSLANSQTALQTVGHNIANKSTEGYSRQRVEISASAPVNDGKLQIGSGARASAITRTANPWLEKQIQREQMNMGYLDGRADSLSRVEQVYNEQLNKGLNMHIVEFFNAFRELSASPESLASRSLVKETSLSMVKDFQRVTKELSDVQKDVDGQLKVLTNEINQSVLELSKLNERIAVVEGQGVPANDERDRREVLLKKLGEKIDISWAEGTDGMVSVTAGKTALLVTGTSANELKTYSFGNGDKIQVYFQQEGNKTPIDITRQISGGRMGGALEIRDVVVEDLLSKIDQLAYTLATEVNSAHQEGFDRYGVTGISFFADPEDLKDSAANLALSDDVLKDVGRIAVASRPNAAGDNTVANIIGSLQYQKVMDNNSSTFDDFYNSQVGQIGTVAQRAVKSRESQKNVIEQLDNIRESISGVSLDEETTKMVEFQKTYDASARLIKTADEMFDTILNLKRL